MRQRLLLWIALVGLVGCHPASPPQAMKHVAAGEIGSSLPDFSVKDLEGHPLSSAGLPGKVVLVDFWATWSQPCKKEIPDIRNSPMSTLLTDSLLLDSNLTTCGTWKIRFDLQEIGVHYPLAVATDDLKQKFGGIAGLPT